MFSLQLQVLMSVREFEQISFRAQEAAMEDRPTIINVDGTAALQAQKALFYQHKEYLEADEQTLDALILSIHTGAQHDPQFDQWTTKLSVGKISNETLTAHVRSMEASIAHLVSSVTDMQNLLLRLYHERDELVKYVTGNDASSLQQILNDSHQNITQLRNEITLHIAYQEELLVLRTGHVTALIEYLADSDAIATRMTTKVEHLRTLSSACTTRK